MSQDKFSIEESIQESLSFSHSLAKISERASKRALRSQQSDFIEEEDIIQYQSSSIVEEIIGESQIKSSIYFSNAITQSKIKSSGFAKDTLQSGANSYDQSMLKREERNVFIEKKFNKLRKDIQYGPKSDIQKKMRTKDNKVLIEKLKSNIDKQNYNHDYYANTPCQYCENISLKELKIPQAKVDKLFIQEFLDMKYNKYVEEKDDKEEQRLQALKEYATEIERREVINRKVFQLKQKLIYGDDVENLDFNYRQ
ncbi:UNKNOWN [Stylonychia lemnae]|uniref:Uncharacterized protein n=1 Tax=Stylonychia lemnae TaxID=5949 RepID=A0A078A7X0_STYLE|nr:UNKNOWN [Stylonychia lemnae]|eukprot:CDW78349.1 UNKNOWN [Stylonychia lemnae]